MIDGIGRKIDYLRLSVTDRCNLRCRYCMPAEGVRWVPHSAILTYEEMLRLAGLFYRLGFRKVKLTGGEPLARRGLETLVAGLKKIGMEWVTLTTNGTLLSEQLPALVDAGLDGVNISLDAVEEEVFQAITRRPGVDTVLRAIDDALACPGLTVKVNCVPTALNKSQLVPLARLARDRDLAVRYIEVMPIGLGGELAGPGEEAILAELTEAFGPLTPIQGPVSAGPSRYVKSKGFTGSLGFISAVSHQFCHRCNRVRLTAEGYLKTCLQYDAGADLKALLGKDDDTILAAIQTAIAHKPAAHHFSTPRSPGDEGRIMSQIGG